jgi:hypothetical protein
VVVISKTIDSASFSITGSNYLINIKEEGKKILSS